MGLMRVSVFQGYEEQINDEHDNARWYQRFLWITDLPLRNGVWGMSGHRTAWAQPLKLFGSIGPYQGH